MEVSEFVKINRIVFELMAKNGIHPKDAAMVDIAEEAQQMQDAGEMKRVIVYHLSQKYKISERSVYTMIEKMKSTLKF